jgi:hypothetical protein
MSAWVGAVLETARYAAAQTSVVLVDSDLPSDGSYDRIRARARIVAETLRSVAALSGGEVLELDRDDDVADAFLAAIERFRSSYVLRFAPIDRSLGWHDVQVRLKGGAHGVRARRGYWMQPGQTRRRP